MTMALNSESAERLTALKASALTVPVAFIVFNRPEITEKSFSLIRNQRPTKLFIIADGPRPNRQDDIEKCSIVRHIVSNVDWPCEVHRNYSETNLGCKYRPITGLDWVFQSVDRAIILEDDVMPSHDFFKFCSELLDYYAVDDRVWVITGDNFQGGQRRGEAAYYFSCFNHVWGWATWRRAWEKNDPHISFWPAFQKTKQWQSIWRKRSVRKYWETLFDNVYKNKHESAWDYPWTASIWFHGGLTATPNINLVSNLGFGPDATHTTSDTHKLSNIPVESLGNLTHPTDIVRNEAADQFCFDYVWNGKEHEFPKRHLLLLKGIPARLNNYIYHLLKNK
jgi:hypothetical protein